MNNSVSEHSLYIESEDDEDEEKVVHRGEAGDGNESDSSDSSNDNQLPNKQPSSYNTNWPQSYRQSIDMYGSVQSPSIGFLGTPTLTRFSSSFLSAASLTRRHTPEILPSVVKPLLPTVDDDQSLQHQRRSSHALLPPLPKKKKADGKVLHEAPIARQSSYAQAVLNGVNVLCGVGILSTPFAAKEGGWAGLCILFLFAFLSFYTGILLRHCLDSAPGLETYPDIGQAAFGTVGRVAISIILYVELYACCVEYVIMESDNLSSLFPNAHLSLAGFDLNAHHLFALVITIAVLPTVYLRDLSILSYLSAGGVIASVLVAFCLFWVGTFDGVGFHNKGTSLNLSTISVAIGLYGYCYSGHAVFPNIYISMAKPSQYPMVLLTSFGICTVLYAGVAVMGYTMFGELTESQFTLNLPTHSVASKIAVWTTVVNPFTKYALTMTPVALSLEELIPSSHVKSHVYSIIIRTTLVFSTLFVGLAVPFFGLVMALIGSLLTMLVTLILPCLCFLRIVKGNISRFQASFCMIIIAVGVVSCCLGSYSALSKIIESLHG